MRAKGVGAHRLEADTTEHRLEADATSRRAIEASAMFGLAVGEAAGEYEEATEHADRMAAALHRRLWSGAAPRGMIVLVTGPSGSGKSLVLSRLGALLGPTGFAAGDAAPSPKARVVDLFHRSLDGALRNLARAGLADARLFARRVGELSDGERSRLWIALAMERVELERESRPDRCTTVLIDEFCATLDRPAAWGVAAMMRRWVSDTPGVRAVCATSHEDLEAALRPDVVVRMELGREGRVEEGEKWEVGSREWGLDRRIVIREGTRGDYAALSRFHYRAGSPATWARVMVAEAESSGKAAQRHSGTFGAAGSGVSSGAAVVGVLVVSRPALNGPWRAVAWPGRYESGEKREDARRLNAEVRTISRVIVEPRWRGLGVATRLVRAYLDDPLTARTEAIAAMGACCPVFGAAGMRGVEFPRSRRDERLVRALAGAGVEPWELADPLRRRGLGSSSELERELRIWADAARGTRRWARSGIPELMRGAARGLGERRVYVVG